MGFSIYSDTKEYFKLSARARVPGLTQYKDYKRLMLALEGVTDVNGSATLQASVAKHRFEVPAIILLVFQYDHIKLGMAAGGGNIDCSMGSYLNLNNNVLFRGGVATKQKLNTNGVQQLDISDHRCYPLLYIPVEEDDELRVDITGYFNNDNVTTNYFGTVFDIWFIEQ